MTADTPEYLFWLDLETTGLDKRVDLILEVAAVVTTADLERVVDQYHRVIGAGWGGMFPPKMDDIVREMHLSSGLLDEVGASDYHDLTVSSGLRRFADLYPGAYLAGSGVHFDRGFLEQKWPRTLNSLHYRNLDVSSLRTFVNLYAPHAAYEPKKAHRAMDDVQDAVAELRHYRAALAAEVTV